MNDFLPSVEKPEWVNYLPEFFHRFLLGVEVWQWVGLIALIGLSRITLIVGNRLAVRAFRLRAKHLAGEVSNETVVATRRAVGLIAGALVCYPLVGPLDLPRKLERGVMILLEGMTIFAFSMLVYAMWDAFCDSIASKAAEVSSRAERLLVPMIRKLVRLVIVSIGLFFALGTLFDVNVAAVLASLGVGGIVVALAAKDSVENIFGSLTILFDMPFQIGDWVKVDKIEGIVEELNLRSTRIRTFEDTIINLPNANLIRAAVENVSLRRYRRQKFNVRVSYDTPVDKLNALCTDIRNYLNELEGVDPEKVIVNLSDMDDTGLTVLVQCNFEVENQAEELEMRHRLLTEISRMRHEHGVLFYPAGVARLPEPPKDAPVVPQRPS